MRAHKLKTWPEYFHALMIETKTCEVRRADRDFRVGDYLMLVEFDPKTDKATGAYVYRRVMHILNASDAPRGLCDGFVAMSITDVDSVERDKLLCQYRGMLASTVEWLKPSVVAL